MIVGKTEKNDKVPSVYEGSDPSTEDQLGKRKCLSTFFSSEFRTDRRVNGGSNKEPLTRWGDEAFGDLNRVIVGEIEENDDKVRSVYGGSVEQTACLNLARSCAPKPRRVPKPGRRSHAEARPGRVRRSLAAGRVPKPGRAPVNARRGPARPGAAGPARRGRTARCGPVRPVPARPSRARPGRSRDRDGKDGLDDGRDHLCM